MVIDSSAVMAILGQEPEEAAFRQAIKLSPIRLLSAATRVEISLVVLGRRGEAGLEQLQALLESFKLDIVPVSDEHATFAIDAFQRFGKGRHPAGLNYGDCLAYALAKATGEPLLYKGQDFARTDIKPAV